MKTAPKVTHQDDDPTSKIITVYMEDLYQKTLPSLHSIANDLYAFGLIKQMTTAATALKERNDEPSQPMQAPGL